MNAAGIPRTSAILLAAGSGNRMQSQVPKQFLLLKGKPLLWYSLNTLNNSEVAEIILVTREEDISYCRDQIVRACGFEKVRHIVPGGNTRYRSVWEGLKAVSPDCSLVMVHDCARPFLTEEMIRESIQTADLTFACTVGVPVKDTIKEQNEEGFGIRTPDRRNLMQIQTPQTFHRRVLEDAYQKLLQAPEKEQEKITDDTMVVEKYGGIFSRILPGSYENLKVTTPEDLIVAEALLRRKDANEKSSNEKL